jgi:hypothetical protein
MRFSDPLALVISQCLIDLGLGSDPTLDPQGDWPTFYSAEVDSPDRTVIVFRTEGVTGDRMQVDGSRSELPGFNIRIRAGLAEEAEDKADEIRDALNTVYQQRVDVGANSYVIHAFLLVSHPIDNGTEPTPTKRPIFTLNGYVEAEQLP